MRDWSGYIFSVVILLALFYLSFYFYMFPADWLGYSREILVVCETASGFALFNYDGVQLFLPKAIEVLASIVHLFYSASLPLLCLSLI